MLTLTDNARAVVASLVQNENRGAESGLRIAQAETDDDRLRFSVSLASAPEADDQIIETTEARVFVEPDAVAALSDKMLDAGIDEQGGVNFTLLPQPLP